MRSPFISLSTVQVRLAALSLLLGLSTQWSDAHAFKTGTHVAAANQVVDELNISLDAAGGTLEFEINGRRLEIEVTAPDAYDAVRNFPDSFAAGAMGPDGFPDPVTGPSPIS